MDAKEREVIAKVEQIFYTTFYELQATLPYRTGRLAYIGCEFIMTGPFSYVIRMNEQSVPYAKYVDRFYPGFWQKFLNDYKRKVTQRIKHQVF